MNFEGKSDLNKHIYCETANALQAEIINKYDPHECDEALLMGMESHVNFIEANLEKDATGGMFPWGAYHLQIDADQMFALGFDEWIVDDELVIDADEDDF